MKAGEGREGAGERESKGKKGDICNICNNKDKFRKKKEKIRPVTNNNYYYYYYWTNVYY